MDHFDAFLNSVVQTEYTMAADSQEIMDLAAQDLGKRDIDAVDADLANVIASMRALPACNVR